MSNNRTRNRPPGHQWETTHVDNGVNVIRCRKCRATRFNDRRLGTRVTRTPTAEAQIACVR